MTLLQEDTKRTGKKPAISRERGLSGAYEGRENEDREWGGSSNNSYGCRKSTGKTTIKRHNCLLGRGKK